MQGKNKETAKLVSFVLIGLVLASIFAGVISGAGVGVGGAEEAMGYVNIMDAGLPATSFLSAQIPFLFMPNDNSLSSRIDGIVNDASNEKPHQAEQDNGAVSDVNVTASSTTCNSCSDCSNKLKSGLYSTVILKTDITNHEGNCIGLILGESNVVFDCGGHTIDGDDIAIDPEHGIAMMHGEGNTIKNCVISDFSNGIYLWDASDHTITGNTITSNNEGIKLGWSDSNDINTNTVNDNYNGIRLSNSDGNAINSNVVCNNEYLDFIVSGKNSGDNNTCDKPGAWDDAGTTGCTYSCPSQKPDLIITDVWSEDSDICYQIRNIGNATAPKGHYTALSIDGEPRVNDLVEVELAPKERLKQCFNYAWQCSPPDDTITVCADYKDVVNEANEGNNCRNETWKCDNTPPVIISGPTVSEITQSSVTISWTTDEASDSLVRFGRTAGKYEDQKFSLKMKQDHKLILTDLLPSTTYHYVVKSTDASNNTVVSRDALFETGPVPDDKPPVVHALNITRGKGDVLYYEMSADASDNVGVERVEFYMDDMLIGTDYSEPYQCYMTPASIGMMYEEFLEEHTVAAVAFDECRVEGRLPGLFDPPYECEAIGMEMRHPYSDYTIYIEEGDTVPAGTIVPIEVYAALEQESCVCAEWRQDARGRSRCVRFSCTTMCTPVSEVEFYVNLAPIPNTSSGDVYTANWDASGLPPGTYTIRVDAIASEGCKQTIIRDVSIEEGVPSLDISREVSRIDNYFQVELTVENSGTGIAHIDKIEDNVDGFQPIAKSTAEYDVITECSDDGRHCDIEIDLPGSSFTLGPDEHIHVEYLAVPVLYPDTDPVEYAIGAEDVTVHHSDGSTESFDRPCVLTTGGELLSSSVDSAVEWSNYLIVTHPTRLFSHYTDADVNELLSAMAELAQLKHGIPGYVQARRASNVRDRIVEWGSDMNGSDGTPDNYLSNGYLLIVGETEIIGSWEIKIKNRPRVHYTDLPYANTAGEWKAPELIVGRIIGNDASELIIPIQTSINVYKGEPGFEWDRSHALAVSGGGDGANKFERTVDDVADILDDEFSVQKLKQRDVEDAGGDITAEFKAHDANRDVIFFRDHGWPTAWSGVINRSHFRGADPVDFENSKPFAFACCCWAGRYEDEDISDPPDGIPEGENGIAETFLQHGTAVYIGATQVSYRNRNNRAAEKFFEDWWVGSSDSIGLAFRNFKRDFNGRRGRRYWIAEYNLYGDPTYGSASTVAGAVLMPKVAASEPPTSLEIVIPDYNVTTTEENEHYVEIPGGDTILELDKPMVPFYTANLDYPAGYRVQDVILTDRSGMTTETGLNIPNETMETDSATIGALSSTSEEEWWPEEVFEWDVWENPDGTSTLIILMYPFYYNPLTTDVEFYRNYTFEINYTTSTVEIVALTTDKDIYQQGDDILVNLWLNNSGDDQNVIVDAVVKAGGSGEIVDGLLLRTLKGFAGHASFSPRWDSSGVEPGYYFVEVTLKDTSGNVLDRKTEMFRLGVSSGEITNFTATPEYFHIGDDIEINMTFNNNGTVNITGDAVTKIINSTGYVAEEFRHNVTDLTPSESVSFSDVWNTSGADEGSYSILGYVLYDSKATEPVTVIVSTIAKIFDTGAGMYPSIMGNHTGTIKPNHTVIATRMYTYPCPGTGGHTEYARIWNATWNVTAKWEGYAGDWHNISFNKPFTLVANEKYNYTIRTGSYPQIHHTDELKVDDGIITCDKFIDANGKVYYNGIPAIKLLV